MTYRIVTLDFETEFFDDFSLSKETTESYVRSSRFKAHGAAIKWDCATKPEIPARWYDERELRHVLAAEDWSNVFLLNHHSNFDGLILSHHYNVVPAMYGDTLGMSRLLLGNHISVSLDSVRRHFGMPLKSTPYSLFKNKTWVQLSPAVREQIADGACDEVESIYALFTKHLAPNFPIEEYDVIDSLARMFCQPVLKGDVDVLADVWRTEESKKRTLLTDLGFDLSTDAGRAHAEAQLQSAERFADLLRAEGVEPETKISVKGNTNYAFAKTDPFMRDVLPEHESERVRALAQARLGVKSTILQTRAETYGFMAQRGPLPVYLRYAGAGTLRPSGGDGGNWLNLKRGSALRRALRAPDGYWIAPVDASQIECRCLHYLAGGPDEPVIQKFRNHEDPYVDLATQFYREPIYKPKRGDPRQAEMEAKRGMGKQGRLMCGYGAAGKEFKQTAKNGLYGPPVDIAIEDADAFVQLYRQTNPSICNRPNGYWAQCEQMLKVLAYGSTLEIGPLLLHDHKIFVGPGRIPMNYDSLEWFKPPQDQLEDYREWEWNGFWRLKTRQGWKTMWGSKLTQNICEGVSRVIVSQAMTRIKRQYNIRTLNWPYDELLLLIPKGEGAEKTLELCVAEMQRTPDWLPGLPLDAETSGLSDRYEK